MSEFGKRQNWDGGNMLYPLPVIMVSVRDPKTGKDNIITLAWAGTICSDPPMASISVRKERFSHPMLMAAKEFVINLTTKELAFATDLCGVKSGRDFDKFELAHLTKGEASKINAPLIMESPVNLECKVEQVLELGSHDMFIAKVVGVDIDENYLDEKGKFHLNDSDLLAYSHGEYFNLGEKLGTFGYSVRKKK